MMMSKKLINLREKRSGHITWSIYWERHIKEDCPHYYQPDESMTRFHICIIALKIQAHGRMLECPSLDHKARKHNSQTMVPLRWHMTRVVSFPRKYIIAK